MSTKVLVIDNYDSFVFNLVQYIAELGAEPVVVRNDVVEPTSAGARALLEEHAPTGVLISPGPGTPAEAGISNEMVRACADSRTPLFGVCLGHQCIGEVFGGDVVHAPELLHGKTSLVEHDNTGVLRGLPSPFVATRYHSLVVDSATFPSDLIATGHTDPSLVMALRHPELPIDAVQFHPESVLTQTGYRIVANWLTSIGCAEAESRFAVLDGALDDVRAAAHFSSLD
ncbi:anthranilate synthase component II [Cumulibacter soli]|uniref:anthranilate synthase component II n=1 Tax=Cumulibacter soli TaxID=2546344 RepID=UPI00106886F2|nr:gamma-glutamyl-gamma-aminobutyrate hydrolase family protein [Cumulibacter soli]